MSFRVLSPEVITLDLTTGSKCSKTFRYRLGLTDKSATRPPTTYVDMEAGGFWTEDGLLGGPIISKIASAGHGEVDSGVRAEVWFWCEEAAQVAEIVVWKVV
jgi:hypothetical protein